MDGARRGFLKRTIALLAAGGLISRPAKAADAAEGLDVPPWMKSPGAGFNDYGAPAKYESKVTRTFGRAQRGRPEAAPSARRSSRSRA